MSGENIAAALVAALADLTIVEKGRTAKIPTKDGKSYSYEYADIADVVKLTRPVLAAHGLVALTPIHDHGSGLACTVTILHMSGERLDFGPFPFDGARDAQATGSAVTYFRRYALVAALGMAAGDDDDGASAKASQTAPRRQERPQEPPPGKPKAQVKGDLVTYLTGKVPEGTEKDHAAQVWTDAEVKVIDGKWVAPDEVSVLMATAKDHAENLAAVNA
jgi:hypothetical protein